MGEFKREERFIVVKLKTLDAYQKRCMRDFLSAMGIRTCECVVVESDWPEYEQVWEMIAARVEGRPTPYQLLEQQVAALRQHKTDYMEAAEGTRRALEAEAKALREEVATYEDGMRSLASQLGAGGFNAEKLSAAQLLEKVQWGINNFAETQGRLLDEVRAARDELRARVVVVPPSPFMPGIDPEDLTDYERGEAQGRCDMWEEFRRLNGKAVSEGLLRRIAEYGDDFWFALDELKALLGEGKEASDA